MLAKLDDIVKRRERSTRRHIIRIFKLLFDLGFEHKNETGITLQGLKF